MYYYGARYYDNYNYPAAPTSFSAIEEQTVNQDIKGYPTGVWTRVLTSSSELVGELTHYLYDNKYRLIRKHQTNSLGGYTQTDHKLNFSGLPIKTEKQQKYAANGNVLKLTTNYEYDINNRILSQKQQINAGAVEHLFLNTYDELGRIKTKHTGGISANLQKVDYTYNIRGWLSGINTEEATPFVSDLYKQKIYYHEENAGINTPMYDGSISYIETRTLVDNKQRGYRYIYDELNRLEKADFFEGQDPINKNSYKEYLTYDKNGNIQTLSRTGALISHQPVEIDELVYVYQGNQVQSITDATANSEGFSDGNTQGEDYVYDEFGNLVQDKNKNISSIGYNHLNLPVRILFSDTSSIHYVYDAMGGRKSKKVQPASGAITTADYQDIFQYENGALQFISQPEGYIKPHNGGYLYVYQYKDHLGNIRLSYADIDGNGSIDPASEILEENNYYPFGMKHQGYNEVFHPQQNIAASKYKYSGKEWNDELDLNLYDFHARNYDPAIGRWLSVDPLGEKYPNYTPYHYVHQNPINMIDPTGMEADHIIIRGKKENYHYNENEKYTGNDKFIKATLSAIGELKKSQIGNDMINELDASDNNFYIQSGTKDNFEPESRMMADQSISNPLKDNRVAQGKIGSGGIINWSQKDMRLPTTTSDLSSKEIILGHEMAHALDSNKGLLDSRINETSKRAGENFTRSEWQAVYRENLIRSELNLPLRTHYGRSLEKGTNKYIGPLGTKMLGKKNQIIKPSWYE